MRGGHNDVTGNCAEHISFVNQNFETLPLDAQRGGTTTARTGRTRSRVGALSPGQGTGILDYRSAAGGNGTAQDASGSGRRPRPCEDYTGPLRSRTARRWSRLVRAAGVRVARGQ